MTEAVGVIGLGHLGAEVARRLLASGHRVTVYDTSRSASEALVSLGAVAACSPAEVADSAEVVLVSVSNRRATAGVICGRRGVIEGSAVRFVATLSTVGSSTVRALSRSLEDHLIEFVDAPVSGGTADAAKGTLTVMVGASVEAYERVAPLLEPIGRVFHVGNEPGAGQAMKVASSYLAATALAAASEAVVVGVKAGLDPMTMIEVFNAGSARSSATENYLPTSVLNRRFDGGGATGDLYEDVKTFAEHAESLKVPLPLGSAVRHVWFCALAAIGPSADFTRIYTEVEFMADVHLSLSIPPVV